MNLYAYCIAFLKSQTTGDIRGPFGLKLRTNHFPLNIKNIETKIQSRSDPRDILDSFQNLFMAMEKFLGGGYVSTRDKDVFAQGLTELAEGFENLQKAVPGLTTEDVPAVLKKFARSERLEFSHGTIFQFIQRNVATLHKSFPASGPYAKDLYLALDQILDATRRIEPYVYSRDVSVRKLLVAYCTFATMAGYVLYRILLRMGFDFESVLQ